MPRTVVDLVSARPIHLAIVEGIKTMTGGEGPLIREDLQPAAPGVIVAGNSAIQLYDNIAAKIKSKSDKNSCTLVYGTDHDDGCYEGYAYQATTTGKKCDTTAIEKSINDAVRTCATKLHKARAVTGCCRFSHGGSWRGHLRLSANPDRYPIKPAQC